MLAISPVKDFEERPSKLFVLQTCKHPSLVDMEQVERVYGLKN